MPFYKNGENGLYYLDSVDFFEILPTGCVQITDAEAQEIIAAANVVNAKNLINTAGFIQDIKQSLGGIVAVNQLMMAYPAFLPAIEKSEWQDVKDLLNDAAVKNAITSSQYLDIKTAATNNNIPLGL